MASYPTNIADCDLLPGTRSWEAKKGCYVVSRFNTGKVARLNFNYVQPLLVGNITSNQTTLVNVAPLPTSSIAWSLGSSPSNYTFFTNNVWNDQDMSGAYFTGLNANDVLTVNYNVYIERFPALSDLNLIVLATPSPSYDEVAIKAYSEVSRLMPTGVPQAENGLGDWFKGIVNTVANVASTVLPFFGPKAAIGGAIAGGIARLTDQSGETKGNYARPAPIVVQESRAETAPNSWNNPNNGRGRSQKKPNLKIEVIKEQPKRQGPPRKSVQKIAKEIQVMPRRRVHVTPQMLNQAKAKLKKTGQRPKYQKKKPVVIAVSRPRRGFPLGI